LDSSLSDIREALRPTFSPDAVAALSRPQRLADDSTGARYLPGLPGIANLGRTDYVSAAVHLLARVGPLREQFLLQPHAAAGNCSALVAAFGSLMRRLWTPHALRATVAPHAFLAAVTEASANRFTADSRSDAVSFLQWLLRTLHHDLLHAYPGADAAAAEAAAAVSRTKAKHSAGGGGAAGGGGGDAGEAAAKAAKAGRWHAAGGLGPGRSVVTECFEGEVEVTTLTGAMATRSTAEAAASREEAGAEAAADAALWESAEAGSLPGATVSRRRLPTQLLSLDLPPMPLFRDAEGGASIPQVSLGRCLAKFDGVSSTPAVAGGRPVRHRYRLLRPPRFLLLHPRRFMQNAFFLQKNLTIVTFPLRGLDLTPCLAPAAVAAPYHPCAGRALADAGAPRKRGGAALPPSPEAAAALPVAAARELCRLAGLGREAASLVDRGSLRELAARAQGRLCGLRYDLLGTVVHGGGTTAAATSSADDAKGSAAAVEAIKARRRAAAAVGVVRADKGASAYGRGSTIKAADPASVAAAAAKDAASTGSYRCAVLSEAAGRWFEADDLDVRDVHPQSVAVSEAYLLLYRQGSD